MYNILFNRDELSSGKPFMELPGGRIVLYHGTTSVFLDDIIQFGLKPNDQTGNSSLGCGGFPGLVYLGKPREAWKAACQAKSNGGEPVMLEVVVDTARLVPDEDSGLNPLWENKDYMKREDDLDPWLQSLLCAGSCAHKGVIDSGSILVLTRGCYPNTYLRDPWDY